MYTIITDYNVFNIKNATFQPVYRNIQNNIVTKNTLHLKNQTAIVNDPVIFSLLKRCTFKKYSENSVIKY